MVIAWTQIDSGGIKNIQESRWGCGFCVIVVLYGQVGVDQGMCLNKKLDLKQTKEELHVGVCTVSDRLELKSTTTAVVSWV